MAAQEYYIIEDILQQKSDFKDSEIFEEQTHYYDNFLKNRILQTVSRCGLRGLQVLSLSECRNFSDAGLEKLGQMKFLKKLNLLWCTKIEDQGLNHIWKQFKYIRDLDLGGTGISATGLRELVNQS